LQRQPVGNECRVNGGVSRRLAQGSKCNMIVRFYWGVLVANDEITNGE
jgi:hypothetical protein